MTFTKLFDANQGDGFTHLFEAFKDHRVAVRSTAAEVISECVKQISER